MILTFNHESERLWRCRRPDGTNVGSIMELKNPKKETDFLILGNKREPIKTGGTRFTFEDVPKDEIDQIVDFADQLAMIELGL